METIIKKALKEKKIVIKTFDSKIFKKLLGMWLLGGFLSLIPIGLVFILNPIENLTLWQFFSYFEIIYVCVTMAIILTADLVLKNVNLLFWINLVTIIIGSLMYGLLKGGVQIPVFNVGNNFSMFNIIFLVFVLLVGVLSYINISFVDEVVG